MTPRQAFALSNVILDPSDTRVLMKFAKTIKTEAGHFGTIITVDFFIGEFRWHVSITSLAKDLSPVDWDALDRSQRESVRKLAKELLLDVGHDVDAETAEGKTYHVTRKLTIEEERRID